MTHSSGPGPAVPPALLIVSSIRSGVRNPPRSSHIPQHGDQRCSQFHNRYDRLRLDGAILESIDNGLLEFDLRTTSRAYGAPVWNGNVAVDVYSLSRNGNKITGANASLGRDEQSPRSRLKKCHAENVSDAKNNVLRSPAVLKFAARRLRTRRDWRRRPPA